nr:MAG TPA: Insect allergen related repeat, nitrile-specifier detoxification [Caudoviricetes sp.]
MTKIYINNKYLKNDGTIKQIDNYLIFDNVKELYHYLARFSEFIDDFNYIEDEILKNYLSSNTINKLIEDYANYSDVFNDILDHLKDDEYKKIIDFVFEDKKIKYYIDNLERDRQKLLKLLYNNHNIKKYLIRMVRIKRNNILYKFILNYIDELDRVELAKRDILLYFNDKEYNEIESY